MYISKLSEVLYLVIYFRDSHTQGRAVVMLVKENTADWLFELRTSIRGVYVFYCIVFIAKGLQKLNLRAVLVIA